MKLALFKVGKKAIFPKFFENPSNDINMGLAWILAIDEDIISINNNKNIKLLGQDLIDITLKTGQCVEEPKKYYLVLKVAIFSLKDRFPFIALFYPHLMVSTCEIKLGELFGLT